VEAYFRAIPSDSVCGTEFGVWYCLGYWPCHRRTTVIAMIHVPCKRRCRRGFSFMACAKKPRLVIRHVDIIGVPWIHCGLYSSTVSRWRPRHALCPLDPKKLLRQVLSYVLCFVVQLCVQSYPGRRLSSSYTYPIIKNKNKIREMSCPPSMVTCVW